MYIYIIIISLLYLIFNHNGYIFNDHKNYIKLEIEKAIIITVISFIVLISWSYCNSKLINTNKITSYSYPEEIIVPIIFIFIILYVWIRIIRLQKLDIDINNINTNINTNINNELQETFISSITADKTKRTYSYFTEESKKQFEQEFKKQCYDNKILGDEINIDFSRNNNRKTTKAPSYNDIIKLQSDIQENTIDLALNSDNMFECSDAGQESNKCIIANYIPTDNELVVISNNTFN